MYVHSHQGPTSGASPAKAAEPALSCGAPTLPYNTSKLGTLIAIINLLSRRNLGGPTEMLWG